MCPVKEDLRTKLDRLAFSMERLIHAIEKLHSEKAPESLPSPEGNGGIQGDSLQGA